MWRTDELLPRAATPDHCAGAKERPGVVPGLCYDGLFTEPVRVWPCRLCRWSLPACWLPDVAGWSAAVRAGIGVGGGLLASCGAPGSGPGVHAAGIVAGGGAVEIAAGGHAAGADRAADRCCVFEAVAALVLARLLLSVPAGVMTWPVVLTPVPTEVPAAPVVAPAPMPPPRCRPRRPPRPAARQEPRRTARPRCRHCSGCFSWSSPGAESRDSK